MATYVLAGGGTAGHVNPLISTALAILDTEPEARVIAVGTEGGLENDLVPAAGLELALITKAPLPRRPSVAALRFPSNYLRSRREARELLEKVGADVVVGFGGYTSTPIYQAAAKLGLPIVVHEGNARPGMANKLGARKARVVALTFPSTPLAAKNGRTVTVGLPMRSSIAKLASDDCLAAREAATAQFGLDPARPIVVVTGGSSGALHLNEVVSSAAVEILDAGFQVFHLTGRDKDAPVREVVGSQEGYVILDYLNEMEKAYAMADLIVTRAGAGMVAEVSALGIPAIFVPLPVGNGEQELNAENVVMVGGALLISNNEFTKPWLLDTLGTLDDGKRRAMSAASRGASPLDAADILAREIINLKRRA